MAAPSPAAPLLDGLAKAGFSAAGQADGLGLLQTQRDWWAWWFIWSALCILGKQQLSDWLEWCEISLVGCAAVGQPTGFESTGSTQQTRPSYRTRRADLGSTLYFTFIVSVPDQPDGCEL